MQRFIEPVPSQEEVDQELNQVVCIISEDVAANAEVEDEDISQFVQSFQIPVEELMEIIDIESLTATDIIDDCSMISSVGVSSVQSVEEIDAESVSYDGYESGTYGEDGTMESQSSAHDNNSDAEDEAQDQTVNALLRNDLTTAKDIVSSFGARRGRPRKDADYKPKRRGRKSAAGPSTSGIYVKDKNQRKKQQNRAAATKYRQKKKEEAVFIELHEKRFCDEHQDLLHKKAAMLQELALVKKLLREKLFGGR